MGFASAVRPAERTEGKRSGRAPRIRRSCQRIGAFGFCSRRDAETQRGRACLHCSSLFDEAHSSSRTLSSPRLCASARTLFLRHPSASLRMESRKREKGAGTKKRPLGRSSEHHLCTHVWLMFSYKASGPASRAPARTGGRTGGEAGLARSQPQSSPSRMWRACSRISSALRLRAWAPSRRCGIRSCSCWSVTCSPRRAARRISAAR
jgi:hypothetical protein